MLAPIFSAAGQTIKFRDVLEQRDTGILLVPPPLALRISDEISTSLSEILKNLEQQKRLSLMYPYLYLRDRIKLCAITVSSGAIEISPPFLPSAITNPFAQDGSRRVYLSATMRTQAEFSRAFGRRPDFVIEPETKAGNGERCILFGQFVPEEDTGPKLVAAIKANQNSYSLRPRHRAGGTERLMNPWPRHSAGGATEGAQ
ncbi:MAG: hypothetical protein ACREFJ_10075 [Acetobacteraceae bacterium]